MTTASTHPDQILAADTPATPARSFSLMSIVSFVFQLELREKLAAQTGGDHSEGADRWGM